jgi:hypothetical protein
MLNLTIFQIMKMAVNTTRMLAWLFRHELHSSERKLVVLDFVQSEKSVMTICRCRYCGKTFQFLIKE